MIRAIRLARPVAWNFSIPASYTQLPGGGWEQTISLSGLRLRRGNLRGLGDDTSVDPATGCITDSDGNLLSCPGGVDPYQQIGEQVAQSTNAPALPQQPTNANIYPDGSIVLSNGQVVMPPPPQQPPSSGGVSKWLGQSSAPGWPSNGIIVGVAALGAVAVGLFSRGGRRR